MKRTIAVFTGNRAEYGLQYPILKAIKDHPDLEYRLIVSGAHLNNDFGSTINEIINDGFEIHAQLKMDIKEDSLYGTTKSIGHSVVSISGILNKIKPDFMLVYADRFEGFSAVISSSQMNIATAHVEGGDITEGGALDDSMRHAMTKLSHLHFTTNHDATKRILAMGEEPWRVHTVGFPTIDMIVNGNYASPNDIVSKYSINLDRPIIIFTQHSVTTEFDQATDQICESISALDRISSEGAAQVIITYPNNDAGSKSIIKEIKNLALVNPDIKVVKSLGRYFYHGVLALNDNSGCKVVCVGNSSSGIKETPAFRCPAINIGSRQDGRLRSENVIDVPYKSDQIYDAMLMSINDESFRAQCSSCQNPYGQGDAGKKIASILSSIPLNDILCKKRITY
jgi:UDP-hydrolysing UDP-N-acetyl-D-glucosamine 2-epimerase